MVKYKLIKKYPGSPKVGYELNFKNGFPFIWNNEGEFNLVACENYTEFWEKVEELCVPVGTWFRCSESRSLYQIEKINNDRVYLKDIVYNHSIKNCNTYFKNKIWIPVDLEKEPLFTAKEVESMYYEVVFSRVTNLREQLKKQIEVKIEEKLKNG